MTKCMSKNLGVGFCLRSLNRRRQLRHRRTGLGDPLGMMELYNVLKNVESDLSKSIQIALFTENLK